MKVLSGIGEKSVNLLLALKQASFIPVLCVSSCQQDFTRDGNMKIGLNLHETNPGASRTRLCHISKDNDLTVELRVSTSQEHSEND